MLVIGMRLIRFEPTNLSKIMPPFNKSSIKSESNKLVNVTNELGDKLDKLDWSWSLNLNTIIALIIMIKAEGKIKIKFSFLKNSLISKINLYKKIWLEILRIKYDYKHQFPI